MNIEKINEVNYVVVNERGQSIGGGYTSERQAQRAIALVSRVGRLLDNYEREMLECNEGCQEGYCGLHGSNFDLIRNLVY